MPAKQYLKNQAGEQILTKEETANEHASKFAANSSTANYSENFQTIKTEAESKKLDFTSNNSEVYNKPFRLRDLRRSIAKAKIRAPGPDGIHNLLLKNLPNDTLQILRDILNDLWVTGKFPPQWRTAIVIPVPKPNKDHTDATNYRPIALTSCLCKVLERMVNQRLVWYLEKNGLLNNAQSGFRKHRSTSDHLVQMERYVRDAFANKQHAVAVFFDLEKAYETTWKYGIMKDLHRIGLKGRLPTFIGQYLEDRQFQVRIGSVLSNLFENEEGVPQGGVLSVTLFGIKINGIAEQIDDRLLKALFVDDLSTCFRGRSMDLIERQLQNTINKLQVWALENGFKFSTAKCKILHFVPPYERRKIRDPELVIDGQPIEVAEEVKFLGLLWDSKMTFAPHIRELKKKCTKSLNLMKVVAHTKWGGDRVTLLRLYRALIRSQLDYGSIVYGSANKSELKKLDSIHNSGLRLALGAFRTSPVESLYVEANEPSLEKRRLKLSMQYMVKIKADSSNPAHDSLFVFNQRTRDKYHPGLNLNGRQAREPKAPIGLKLEARIEAAQIDLQEIHPKIIADYPLGTQEAEPIVNMRLASKPKAELNPIALKEDFHLIRHEYGKHDEVYTDGSKMGEKVAAAAHISRNLADETIFRDRTIRLPDGSSIFSAESIGIILALEYYNVMERVSHDVVIYSDSMSCLQAIDNEDTNQPLICRILNLLESLAEKGTNVQFCWVPSHIGIKGNETADRLAKEALAKDPDPTTKVTYTDLNSKVQNYINRIWQHEWGRSDQKLNKVKPELSRPANMGLHRSDEVIITRLRIGHTRATHSYLFDNPRRRPQCKHCKLPLTVEHFLLECVPLKPMRDNHYTADSVENLFLTTQPGVITDYLREADIYHAI